MNYLMMIPCVMNSGNKEIPDAMELIYQSALDLGRHGAVSISLSFASICSGFVPLSMKN